MVFDFPKITCIAFCSIGTCKCKDLVNKSGWGNCEKVSKGWFPGRPICYVEKPSSCPDLKASGSVHGEHMSAKACGNVTVPISKEIYRR